MNLQDTVLSETPQYKLHVTPLLGDAYTGQVHRDKKQNNGCYRMKGSGEGWCEYRVNGHH